MTSTLGHSKASPPKNSVMGQPQSQAAAVYAVVGVNPTELSTFPVDLQRVSDALGIRVYYASFSDPKISGMVVTDHRRVPTGVEPGSGGTIFLRKGEYPPRSRFTLAHEIGHVVLGHGDNGVITDFFRGDADGHSDPKERDANAFAAELLMPRALFTELWESGVAEEDLTMIFGVSATAVAVRSQALHLRNRYAY